MQPPELQAIICNNVLNGEAVVACVRDEPEDAEDSGWQFLCGNDHSTGDEEGHVVKVAEIVAARPELRDIATLPVGTELERATEFHAWERFDIEDEEEGSFTCSSCGEVHDQLPMDFGFELPAAYSDPDFPSDRWKTDENYATYGDGEHYFVRGLLEIPVLDGPGPFCYGIWVSASKKSFHAIQREDQPDEDTLSKPYFGWLQSELSPYEGTLGLKVHARARGDDMRPLIQLEPTDHPLAQEQLYGITMDRVHELIDQLTAEAE